MVSLRIIFLIVVAVKVVDSGGNSVTSISELIDKTERIGERIHDIWTKLAQSDLISNITEIPAIQDFENWVSKFSDVDINKLLNDFQSFWLHLSTQLLTINTVTRNLICDQSGKITNALDSLQGVILAFKAELVHSDLADELALVETFFQNQLFMQQLEKTMLDIRNVLDGLNTSCASGVDFKALLLGSAEAFFRNIGSSYNNFVLLRLIRGLDF